MRNKERKMLKVEHEKLNENIGADQRYDFKV